MRTFCKCFVVIAALNLCAFTVFAADKPDDQSETVTTVTESGGTGQTSSRKCEMTNNLKSKKDTSNVKIQEETGSTATSAQ